MSKLFFPSRSFWKQNTVKLGSAWTQRRDELPFFIRQTCTLYNEPWMRLQWQECVWSLQCLGWCWEVCPLLSPEWDGLALCRCIVKVTPHGTFCGGSKIVHPPREFITLSRGRLPAISSLVWWERPDPQSRELDNAGRKPLGFSSFSFSCPYFQQVLKLQW